MTRTVTVRPLEGSESRVRALSRRCQADWHASNSDSRRRVEATVGRQAATPPSAAPQSRRGPPAPPRSGGNNGWPAPREAPHLAARRRGPPPTRPRTAPCAGPRRRFGTAVAEQALPPELCHPSSHVGLSALACRRRKIEHPRAVEQARLRRRRVVPTPPGPRHGSAAGPGSGGGGGGGGAGGSTGRAMSLTDTKAPAVVADEPQPVRLACEYDDDRRRMPRGRALDPAAAAGPVGRPGGELAEPRGEHAEPRASVVPRARRRTATAGGAAVHWHGSVGKLSGGCFVGRERAQLREPAAGRPLHDPPSAAIADRDVRAPPASSARATCRGPAACTERGSGGRRAA